MMRNLLTKIDFHKKERTAAGDAMAQPPLLALLLLGLFAPRSLAGYCFTSVASPINGYWTWGQTVSTPTLLGPLPLDIGKNPRAPSALHGGAGPRSVTRGGRASPRDSTCAGNPRGPSLVPAWLPVLGKSMPRGTYLCPMPRATTHNAVSRCLVSVTHSCRDSHAWP